MHDGLVFAPAGRTPLLVFFLRFNVIAYELRISNLRLVISNERKKEGKRPREERKKCNGVIALREY